MTCDSMDMTGLCLHRLEKYMGNDLRHVNGARKLLEQIINRLHVDSDEKFPAQ